MNHHETQYRESRRILAKVLLLARAARTEKNARKEELFQGLALAELELVNIHRGQVLRERFLQEA